MIDALCAGLSGGRIGREIVPLKTDTNLPQQVSVLIIAMSPEHFAGSGHFDATALALVDAVRSARPASDHRGPALLPGEPEFVRSQEQQVFVVIDVALMASLIELGKRMGPPFPSQDGM